MTSQCVQFVGANLRQVSVTLENCNTYILLDKTDYQAFLQFAVFNTLTPVDILYIYSWGMGAVLAPWSIMYLVKWILKTLSLI